MTFVTFGLVFGGLAAAGIPVLLHLVMRGRPKKLEFPALRFIRKRFQANKRRFQLKHLILLALRMLILIFLGLALARPTWTIPGTTGSQEAPIAAAIIFDTSPRMNYLSANQTRLDETKNIGQLLLKQFPPESQVAIFDSQRLPGSFQVDFLAARERMERLAVTTVGRTVMESVQEAVKLLKNSELSQKEIYILTDLTEPGWSDFRGTTLQLFLAEMSDVNLHLIDVGIENPLNSSITNIELSEQVLSTRGTLQVDLDLSHIGPKETRTVELFLTAPGEAFPGRKRGTQTVEFPEGFSRLTNVSFRVADLEPGTHQGIVQFTTHDSLANDDAYYFTVHVQQPWEVLIVSPEPINEHAIFLSEALQPTLWQQLGRGSYTVKTVTYPELERLLPQELGGYRAVFLLDPSPLTQACWEKLGNFTADGNGLGLFLGRQAEPPTEFHIEHARELIGMTLNMQANAPDGDVFLAPDQYEHPVLAPFRGIPTDELPWNALPVFRYWQVDQLAEHTEIVVPYSDGRPAILTRSVGRGRLLVMTTPISDPAHGDFWNLIPTGEAFWMFLPLVEGIARHLVGVGDKNFNYLAGQTAIIRPGLERLPGSCVVIPPGGEGLRITPDQNRNLISFSDTLLTGNYRIISGGGTIKLQTGFSVNLTADQWNLNRITSKTLEQLFGSKVTITRDQAKIEREITASRTGRELFPALMILVVIFFCLEYIVSNRFYGTL